MNIPLPVRDTWKDLRFATSEHRDRLREGEHFLICDANPAFESKFGGDQVAFTVQLVGQPGLDEKFIWTLSQTAGRLQLADLVRDAQSRGDAIGPCQVQLVPSKTAGMKPFMDIIAATSEKPKPRVLVNDDDIPF